MTFTEAKKKSISCVYCLEFPNGKKYVGKTKELSKRMSLYERFESSSNALGEAIKEFGLDSIDVKVLCELSCRDKVCLDLALSILEIKFIRDLDTLVPNGLNVSIGGECLGIPPECITTDSGAVKAYNNGSKALLIYDLAGNFIEEYPSIARFAYDKGLDEKLVSGALNRKSPLYNSWYIREKRYNYIPQQIVVEIPEKVKPRIVYEDVIKQRVKIKDVVQVRYVDKIVERKVTQKCHILKYDMNGDFCGEYDSMKDACRSFLPTNTGFTCGVYRNGYVLFKKKDDDFPKKIEPYVVLSKKVLGDYCCPADELEDRPTAKRGRPANSKVRHESKQKNPLCIDGKYTNIRNCFPVNQYSLDGVLLATHGSIRDAADDTGLPYANIWACVMGRTKKAAGYIWRYKDDDIEETPIVEENTEKTVAFSQDLFNFAGEQSVKV